MTTTHPSSSAVLRFSHSLSRSIASDQYTGVGGYGSPDALTLLVVDSFKWNRRRKRIGMSISHVSRSGVVRTGWARAKMGMSMLNSSGSISVEGARAQRRVLAAGEVSVSLNGVQGTRKAGEAYLCAPIGQRCPPYMTLRIPQDVRRI